MQVKTRGAGGAEGTENRYGICFRTSCIYPPFEGVRKRESERVRPSEGDESRRRGGKATRGRGEGHDQVKEGKKVYRGVREDGKRGKTQNKWSIYRKWKEVEEVVVWR